MNLANFLSFSRIPFGLLGLLALMYERPSLFIAALLLGVGTDLIDGKVAKWRGTNSGHGKVIDLFCDQLFEAFLATGLFLTYEFPTYYYVIFMIRVLLSLTLLFKKAPEMRLSPGKMEFRIHSLLSLLVFFFFAFALSIQLEAPPLATGLQGIALPYVMGPLAAIMELMTGLRIIPQLFNQ